MSEVEVLAQEPMAFFPHDANAASDIKCQRLIRRLGYEGYGRWWRLCEYMASTKGHVVSFETDEDALILGDVLGFNLGGAFNELQEVEDCRAYVECLLDVGLLVRVSDGLLGNERMRRNSTYFGKQKANGRKGGRKRKSKADGEVASPCE